jgi:phosphate-selective porin
MAGDLKLGGEMYLNTYFSFDNLAENPDYSGWFKLKLTQDVNDFTSWAVTLNFDYPGDSVSSNSWKTDGKNNSVKFDDAYVKLKFSPVVSMRIGRFETVYDEKNRYFAGEWDNFKEVNDGYTVYALTRWKDNWRERNNFGIEATEKFSDKFSLMETFFYPEDDSDCHYGIKASYAPFDKLLLTGALYSRNDDQESYLLQATYKLKDFSFYGLMNHQNNHGSDSDDIYAYGLSYNVDAFAIYAERYVKTDDDCETKLGYEYYLGKNTALYLNLLWPDNDDTVVRTGLAITF